MPISPPPPLFPTTQLRAFNTPFQLGHAPDSGDAADPRFESPHDASIVRVPVRPGDVLVLATDGLFDNMSEDDLLDALEEAADDASPQVSTRASRAQDLALFP
jgi:protein phosphatase PTC7